MGLGAALTGKESRMVPTGTTLSAAGETLSGRERKTTSGLKHEFASRDAAKAHAPLAGANKGGFVEAGALGLVLPRTHGVQQKARKRRQFQAGGHCQQGNETY